jgi:amidase
LKATNGTVPPVDRTGLGVGGVLCREIVDLRVWLAVQGRAVDVADRVLRVGWSDDLGFAGTAPEIAAIARAGLEAGLGDGALVEVPVDVELLDPEPVWTSLRARTEARGGHGAEAGAPVGVGASAGVTGIRAENDRRLREVFDMVDLIATPTTPNSPHGHDGPGDVMSVALTWAFNLSGHPALSVPAGFTAAGAPVGLQLVARHHHEADLVAAASQLDRAVRIARPVSRCPGRRP